MTAEMVNSVESFKDKVEEFSQKVRSKDGKRTEKQVYRSNIQIIGIPEGGIEKKKWEGNQII